MKTTNTFRLSLGSLFIGFLLASSGAIAHAASLSIQSVTPTGTINPGTVVNFVASATGFTDPTYSLSDAFNGGTSGSIDHVGYFTWKPAVNDAGMHQITVVANDKLGNSATSTVSIGIATNTIVLTTLVPGPVVAYTHPLTFTASAPGFMNPNFEVFDVYTTRTSVNSANINSSGAFSWTPTQDDLGAHTLSIRASDIYGRNAQVLVNVTVINPMISVQSAPTTGTVGTPFTFTATSPTLTSSTYSVKDMFTGTSTVAATNTSAAGVFLWTPAVSDIGKHTLIVTAADTYGNAASTTVAVSITAAVGTAAVTTVPPASVITSLPQTTVTPPVVATSSATANTGSTTSKYRFTTALGIGSKNKAVLELQKRLLSLGFFTGTPTGYYGPATAASVKKFQAAHGLSKVGSVGPATRAALNTN